MFKLAALSTLVAGAAAFAPAQQGASTTALNAFESEVCTSSPRYVLMSKPRLENDVEQHQLFSQLISFFF